MAEAIGRFGAPEIFNTDQGSQFTSAPFIAMLVANKIAISMDGKGAWRDNVFVERLWRLVKYEEQYLRAYASVAEARAGLGRYVIYTTTAGRIRASAPARRTLPASPRTPCLPRPENNSRRLPSTNPAEIPLSETQTLFRQSQPPLINLTRIVPAPPWFVG